MSVKFSKIAHALADGYSIAAVDWHGERVYRFAPATGLWHEDSTLFGPCVLGDAFWPENLSREPLSPEQARDALLGVARLDSDVHVHRKLLAQQEAQLGTEQVRTSEDLGL